MAKTNLSILYCCILLNALNLISGMSVINARQPNQFLDKFIGITSNSSTEDILNAVTKVGEGDLQNGVEQVLITLGNTIKEQSEDLDAIFTKMGIDATTNLLMRPFVGVFEKIAETTLEKKSPLKSLVQVGLEADSKFINSTTKSLYNNLALFENLAKELMGNESIPKDTILGINLVLLDGIANNFQNFDVLISQTLKKVLDAGNGIKSIEEASSAAVTIAKLTVKLFQIYNSVVDRAVKSIQDAAIGEHRADPLKNIIENLDSIKNKQKITTTADVIIKNVTTILGDSNIAIADMFNFLKTKKVTALMENTIKLVLQMGLPLLTGVNDASKSNALETILKTINKTDHNVINRKMLRLARDNSHQWASPLAEQLIGQVNIIRQPTPQGLLQIAVDFCSDVGDALTNITKNEEYIISSTDSTDDSSMSIESNNNISTQAVESTTNATNSLPETIQTVTTQVTQPMTKGETTKMTTKGTTSTEKPEMLPENSKCNESISKPSSATLPQSSILFLSASTLFLMKLC